MKKLKLSNTTADDNPKTFEEWVQIHGEPEYLNERKKTSSSLKISVIDCTKPEEEIDTSGIFTIDDKGKHHLNYPRLLDVFSKINSIVYSNGVFYTPKGAISNDLIKQDIHYSLIDCGFTGRLDTPTKSVFESLKQHCNVEKMIFNDKIIPLGNGDLHLTPNKWEFRLNEFQHCAYRLSVDYTPVEKHAPLFNKWLNDVFTKEDIVTVQEMFGYCLVPVTASQEAFIFVGDAGVGKSGVGALLKGLLGNAFVGMETQQLVTERFQVATVENKLVAYDDDLGSAALTETGLLKKLITADVPIQGERKFADPHEFMSYCRIVASANFMLSSLYDDSDGFFRRLHPILVKTKDPNRKNINRFYETILEQEKSQILRWALEGLQRVINNGWKITWSERSKKYLSQTKSSAVHFEDFLKETCNFSQGDITNAELKHTYHTWCRENGITPSSDKRLEKWMANNHESFKLERNNWIKRGSKQVRGYKNLSVKQEWLSSRISI